MTSTSPRPPESPLVLHVDDSAADRYRRRRALEDAGFAVLEASTGSGAEAVLRAHPADLALVDVRLPDTTGFELARRLKAHAAASHRDLAVILISAVLTESESRVQGLESGADAYLIEPITDAELVATLRAVRRRLEEARNARANERLLDAIFDYVPDGIAVADGPDGRIRRISRFGQELTGARPGDVVLATPPGVDWRVLDRDDGRPVPSGELPLARAITQGAVITDQELTVIAADGRRAIVSCNAGPLRDASGRVTGGIAVWRDVTARRQMEEALRRRSDDLRDADRAKNEFLATVVHELRQPLQAATAALGVMKFRTGREKGEHARDIVERQLEQIGRIAEDLLDATQVVRGQATLRMADEDLAQVLRRALECVYPAFTSSQLSLRSNIPPGPVLVKADAMRLQQVFVNLLANAARYTPPPGQVDVALEASSRHAIVRVKDTGDGIPPERISRIFELFSRASSRAGGFGIGLAVARSLVEGHGGTIEAHSEGVGRGSEFTVRLPLG